MFVSLLGWLHGYLRNSLRSVGPRYEEKWHSEEVWVAVSGVNGLSGEVTISLNGYKECD